MAQFLEECLAAEAESEARAVAAWQGGFLGPTTKTIRTKDPKTGEILTEKEIESPADPWAGGTVCGEKISSRLGHRNAQGSRRHCANCEN